MNKLNSRITIFVFAALLLGGFPNFMMQEAYANLDAVSIQAPANSAYLGNDTTPTIITYRLTENTGDAVNLAATQITLTLTPTAGGSAITCVLTDADEGVNGIPANVNLGAQNNDVDVNLSATALQSSGCFNSQIQDGTTYNLDMGVDGNWGTLNAAQVTSVRFDFTAPTGFTASATAGQNTITLTWNEAVDSAQTPANLANAFSLSGTSLTITEASDPSDSTTMTLTLSGNIPEGDSIQVSYDKDQANGDITDAADTNPNQAPDVNNVSVSLTSTHNGGGSGCKDCEEPTLGFLSSGQRVVEDGFTYNGHSVDVERFFTPYPLITSQVGKQNTAQFKIYENRGPDNIAHFSFAFGLGKGEIISQSQAMIEVDFARDRTQTVTITDPENALDNVSVTTDKVACNGGPTQCLEITINHMFREPLDFNIVATDVWDYSRQSWQNYYNHGIEVVGPSMNSPDEFDGIDKGHIYHLTETSKTTAVDEFGDSWTFQYGKWNKDFIKQARIQDGEKMVFDRMHSDFVSYKENLAAAALIQLSETCPLCIEEYSDFNDSTSLEYVDRTSKLSDPQVQMIMKLESQKAQNILKYIMDPKSSSTQKYSTLLEVEKDVRPISEILEEERMMKVILQAERAWLKQVIAPNQ